MRFPVYAVTLLQVFRAVHLALVRTWSSLQLAFAWGQSSGANKQLELLF